MPMSEYYRELRGKTGNGLLMMPSVAAVVRDEQGRILLIRKKDETLWGCPQGRSSLEKHHPERSAERCLKRRA